MEHFTRHSYVGRTADGRFYVTARWQWRNEQDELSLTGVVGPKENGDALGSSGQTGVPEILEYGDGWDAESAAKLAELWDRWHLNGTTAGSPRQEAWLRENPVTAVWPDSHYDKAKAALAEAGLQPDEEYIHNGKPYSYGSAWLYENVPDDVLEWLRDLPDNAQRLPECWRK